MAGTKAGGLKAAASNKARYGSDFYSKIGREGGKNGNTGGFAAGVRCFCDEFPSEHFLRECAGRKGGRKSRRGKDKYGNR